MDSIERNLAGQLDSIDNLDTAKMTLRWALERLRSLESRNTELQKKYEESRAALLARSNMKERGEAYAVERETYYAKVEALLSEFCGGTLDLKKLLARETELDLKERGLRARQDELEREYASRLELLERDFKKLQAETELRSRCETDKAAHTLEESRVQMEKTYISREVAIHAALRQLDVREKALAERESRLEALLLRGREDNDREFLRLREELLEEQRRRIAAWERDKADMQSSREKAFITEKAHLTAQAGRWEAQAKEYLEKIESLEVEKIELTRASLENSLKIENKVGELEAERRRMEQLLILRFAALEEHERLREAAWREQEDSLRQRTKDAHGRSFEIQSASLEKAKQLEELKQELLAAIRSYKEKLAGLEGPHDRSPEAGA